MEFSAMMEIRRSCRSYQDKTVPREYLVKIAEAGRLTPSACNAQPWKFIVIDEPEAKRRLCDALVLENGITTCPWREQVPAFLFCVSGRLRCLILFKNSMETVSTMHLEILVLRR